jgi:Protein of unknown function (DUF4058)
MEKSSRGVYTLSIAIPQKGLLMPLRDHFHGPFRKEAAWESFHSAWVNNAVRRLNTQRLPFRYRSAPFVHLGALVEVDVATFEPEQMFGGEAANGANGANDGGVATALWAPPKPALTLAISIPIQDVFEICVYDDQRGRRIVAAVEFVSPANKDRPESRRAFAIKCAAYLQQQVSVVVVDVVTERHNNLHVELMELLEQTEAAPWPEGQNLFAVAYRTTKENDAWRLDLWPEPLTLGQPLPTLPLWLASNLAVPLELEATYEETCQVLRIR